ncbi:GNAT family N-acetyltransferase [Planotetraspora sp. A-T 1434]|uniref:GNAT family N-acetyltransferase n=1 Tax=Planotetraspora sp. A-T 1434 TaxID=2979219 RepID=UPI0021BF2593|nr:GNAT family N-acetyltransferase [Planotetraspora sp. A-T 1434]MCT9929786.1 GNAT family N-acetyltransferase [Planotetraspora sp. A-T 1434]
MSEKREIVVGASGVPAVSYVEDVRDGRPWADLVEVIGPDPADAIMSRLRGWAVSAPVELSEELVRRGARLLRHAHEMSCDLRRTPIPGASPPDGFRFVPCDRSPEEIFPAWRSAYPPGHPDHRRRDGGEALREELAPLLRGEILGKLLPCSVLAVDAGDQVVGGVVINDRDGLPWISEVFRHPTGAPRGLGALLLRTAQARAAADGLSTLGLAVTHTNPARHVYERLGFVVTRTSMTVAIPDEVP